MIATILLIVLIIVASEMLWQKRNDLKKEDLQKNDGKKIPKIKEENAARVIFRIIAGIALIKIIKNFFFQKKDGEGKPKPQDKGLTPSAPPLPYPYYPGEYYHHTLQSNFPPSSDYQDITKHPYINPSRT